MKETEYKWKEHERIMKGNECKMKGTCMQMKGKWKKMHANECKMKGTWSVAEQNNCSMHFWACLAMDFGFMLELEYADFHKTLERDRALPKSDNHNNSNYSDVKDFAGSSYNNLLRLKFQVCTDKSNAVLSHEFGCCLVVCFDGKDIDIPGKGYGNLHDPSSGCWCCTSAFPGRMAHPTAIS